MFGRISVVAAVLLLGCENPDQYNYQGYVMDDFFPFDGERSWEFSAPDAQISYKLLATLEPGTEMRDNGATKVFTVRYDVSCDVGLDSCEDGEWLQSVQWASNKSYGTKLYSYSSSSTGLVQFESPIALTLDRMKVGDSATTQMGATLWTSTFVAVESCPVEWTDTWDECVHLELSHDGEAETPGYQLAGDYWAVSGYNVVAMTRTVDPGQWRLLYASYEYIDD